MKKVDWFRACASAIILTGTCSFAVQKAQAAVVFSDDFTRDTDSTFTSAPLPGEFESGGFLSGKPGNANWAVGFGGIDIPGFLVVPQGSATIQGGELAITHSNTLSYFQVGYNTSSFASPWNNVLTENTGKVVWTFNMQSSLADRLNFAGGAGSTYTSVVLASSTNDPETSVGYAVAWGNPNSNRLDQLRLTAFKPVNGVPNSFSFIFDGVNTDNGPFDDIDTEHLSIRVEYDPDENRWWLFARNDGSDFADPATGGDFIEIGNALHTEHVGVPMTQVGFAGIYSQAGTSYTYDNFTISVVPEPSAFLLGSIGLVGITAAHRKLRKRAA